MVLMILKQMFGNVLFIALMVLLIISKFSVFLELKILLFQYAKLNEY